MRQISRMRVGDRGIDGERVGVDHVGHDAFVHRRQPGGASVAPGNSFDLPPIHGSTRSLSLIVSLPVVSGFSNAWPHRLAAVARRTIAPVSLWQ